MKIDPTKPTIWQGGDSERNMTPDEEVWAESYIRELRERDLKDLRECKEGDG